MNTLRKSSLLAVALLTLAAVTGCTHKAKQNTSQLSAPDISSSSAPAPTATLTADPLAIDLGGSVVLNWRTVNATSVTIDGIGPVPVNGTQTATPSTSTNFHLTAKGDGGTAEANVRVTVRVPQVPQTAATTNELTDEQLFHQNVPDIYFDYDSYEIRPDAGPAITQAAAFLNAHPGVHIVIGGYCDDRGSAEFNLALGQNRAVTARNALVQAGVNASRIRTISYGKEKQFCSEETEACWQQNRRAQFSQDR